jgi:hypothetical protein
MGVYEEIRKCTAFLGYPNERGFGVEGTGFFVVVSIDGFDFGYLVSAAHLLWPERWRATSKPCPLGHISIRTSSRVGSPIVDRTTPDEWFFHEDKRVDICAIPTGINNPTGPDGESGIAFLSLPGMALVGEKYEKYGLTFGDEIFIAGAFVGRVGEKKNIPVIRVANIAAMPEEPITFGSPKLRAYLIETRSLGGTSGSPIFVSTEPHFPRRPIQSVQTQAHPAPGGLRPKLLMPYLLVGMVLGSYSGQYAGDFLSEQDTDIQPHFNAGISVAMTAEDILDFIMNDPKLAKRRDDSIRELEKDSGYHPSGAGRAAQGIAQENPQHREDFTSLLNAAAKTKPQAD